MEEEEEPSDGPAVDLGELGGMFDNEALNEMGATLASQGVRNAITLMVRRLSIVALTAARTYTHTRANAPRSPKAP
eukprot:3375749-Prymnesium_polylepis.2